MAALATLKDNGVSVQKMTKMSGANRSTIYRWMSGGDGQPDYDLITRLARAIWRQHPDLARELVEASGYAWAEPEPVPDPPDPVSVMTQEWGADVAERVARQIRGRLGDDADEILQGIAEDLRRPSSAAASARGRAAG